MTIRAESLFTVVDSAALDNTGGCPAVATPSAPGASEAAPAALPPGSMRRTHRHGKRGNLSATRTAFEIAFKNQKTNDKLKVSPRNTAGSPPSTHRPHVPRGQLFGFLGPNGAGKTTTLRMIAGILRATSGTVRIGGVDLAAEPIAAKSKLGFIPDRPFIYEKLTGAEFLRFVAGLYGQDGEKVEHRGRELMALFDLDAWADELVESYSHGMRQKLIISSAFIHRPEVIVVDEPMVGLDPKAARILKDLFREYVRRGHTIMMSTHTLEVAEALCDRIAIIQHGKIRAVGTIQDLRAESTGGGGLEEIFLKLTGELAAREAMEVLDA